VISYLLRRVDVIESGLEERTAVEELPWERERWRIENREKLETRVEWQRERV